LLVAERPLAAETLLVSEMLLASETLFVIEWPLTAEMTSNDTPLAAKMLHVQKCGPPVTQSALAVIFALLLSDKRDMLGVIKRPACGTNYVLAQPLIHPLPTYVINNRTHNLLLLLQPPTQESPSSLSYYTHLCSHLSTFRHGLGFIQETHLPRFLRIVRPGQNDSHWLPLRLHRLLLLYHMNSIR
jgi:hypothetical protein